MKHLLFSLSLILISQQVLFSQAGTLDPTFGVGGVADIPTSEIPSSSSAWGADVAEDGKILVGGRANNPFIVRYLPDGTRDASFGDNALVIYGRFVPESMKGLPGDKTLLLGSEIALLNSDGSEDLAFEGTLPNGANTAFDCTLLEDGKFLVLLWGSTAPFNKYCVARYLEDGTLDTEFGQNGLAFNASEWSGLAYDMTVQPDGKILVTGNNGQEKLSMARYLANGTPDMGFGENGMLIWGDNLGATPIAKKTLVQPDGKILVAADFYDVTKRVNVYRLNTNGKPDSTFGVNGLATLLDFRRALDMFLQSDGKIQIAGGADQEEYLLQLFPNGALDPSFKGYLSSYEFGSGNQGKFYLAQQTDGKIVAALTFSFGQGPMSFPKIKMVAIRFLTDGNTDGSFGWKFEAPTWGDDEAQGMALQPDGRPLIFGYRYLYLYAYNYYSWFRVPFVARFNLDGSRDHAWGLSGASLIPQYTPMQSSISFEGIAAMSNGKTILVYSNSGLKIARFKADLKIDSTFGGDGIVNLPFWVYTGSVIQPDGKVLMTGLIQNGITIVCRYLDNGDLDNTFGSGGISQSGQLEYCIGITLLPNGKIALAGKGGKIAQLTADGQLDPTFNSGGVAEFPLNIRSIATHPNGKIVLGVGDNEIGIAEIATDGAGLDSSFGGGDGIVSFPGDGKPALCNSIAFQPDGKVVATGTNVGTVKKLLLARCTAEGLVDSTFNGTGLIEADFGYQYNVPTNVAIQPNGKIIVGATLLRGTGNRISLLRYLSGLTVGTDHPLRPQTAIMAFPNPFSNALRFDFSKLPTPVSSVDVFDMSGRQVFQANNFAAQKMDVPASKDWMPGVYLLRATSGSGIFVQKMVKQ